MLNLPLDGPTRCGFVAVVGKPNVGKSTLINRIIGTKVSITSSKPQTTRHQIQGVKTKDLTQIVFVDTPGMHKGGKRALNRYMNKAARAALSDVDVVLFVCDSLVWTEEDEMVISLLQNTKAFIIIVVNKVDKVEDKTRLLPHLQKLSDKLKHAEVLPISVLNNINIDVVEQKILDKLPLSPFYFPPDQLSNQSLHFHLSEIIREKLMRTLGEEVPYATTVEIQAFEKKDNITIIHALIWVEKEGQKAIVIGENGQKLKDIGTKARHDMESYLNHKVLLKLWVKVKDSWSDNPQALKNLGYFNFD